MEVPEIQLISHSPSSFLLTVKICQRFCFSSSFQFKILFHPLDNRVGFCFTRIENNRCKGLVQGVKCSRDSCCGTIGKAWGIKSCQKCPEKRECDLGYFKNPKTGKCEDINECKGLPNICSMGTCVNAIGSYRCECGPGRLYNPEKLQCEGIHKFSREITFALEFLHSLS